MTVSELRKQATRRIRSLPTDRLVVAIDFLAYLQEREENEATRELLRVPGFASSLAIAARQVRNGRAKNWRKVRRDV